MATPARVGCAIVGPTASGKTALSTSLASKWGDVELVSVDAMAVYRGLDIGTAKPTDTERSVAPWHLIDIVEPSEEFSVASFQECAQSALSRIDAQGHRSILVGGTGLYHRAVIDELEIPHQYPDVASELRERAVSMGLAHLYAELVIRDPLGASRIEPTNERRIVRALEVTIGSGMPFSSYGPGLSSYGAANYMLVGLELPRDVLHRRIEARLDEQFDRGFLDEVKGLLAEKLPLSRTARQALGYRELIAHLEEGISFDETRSTILQRTRNFARRQIAWFRRDPRVIWLNGTRDDLEDEVTRQFSQWQSERHEGAEKCPVDGPTPVSALASSFEIDMED